MNETYEPPTLVVVGTVETLTAGGAVGQQLDAAFPVHTPKGELTFS